MALRCPQVPSPLPSRLGLGFLLVFPLGWEPPWAESESPALALETMGPYGWARIPSPPEWAHSLIGPESFLLLLCPQISVGPGLYPLLFLLCPEPGAVYGPGIFRT